MARAAVKKKQQGATLIDKAAKLPLLTRIIIFVACGLVMGLVFYIALYMPYADERDGLTRSVAQLQKDIGQQQQTLKKHEAVQKTQGAIEEAYQYMQKYLPQENEMPSLVQMVSEIGSKAGLTDGVTLFAPKLPAVVQENYAEIPFTMNLQGEFLTVLSFLYDFSRMDRIVNVTTVDIGSPKMVDSAREIFHVTVKCTGSTYRTLTDEEIANQTKKPTTKSRGRAKQ